MKVLFRKNYEFLEIVYIKWRLHFRNTRVGQLFKVIWRFEKLTFETAFPEDGADERWNALEH